MKAFMDKDFILETPTAQHLYHDYASKMPLADYHCHLNPKEIYEDRRFNNLAEVWLGGLQPDGSYLLAGQPVTVRNGRALTEDGALAGSTLNLWDGVKNLMRFASIPLEDAIACATINPARMVGIDADVGSIESGRRADFLLVDGFCHRRGVIAGGEPQDDALLCLKEITGSEGRS